MILLPLPTVLVSDCLLTHTRLLYVVYILYVNGVPLAFTLSDILHRVGESLYPPL